MAIIIHKRELGASKFYMYSNLQLPSTSRNSPCSASIPLHRSLAPLFEQNNYWQTERGCSYRSKSRRHGSYERPQITHPPLKSPYLPLPAYNASRVTRGPNWPGPHPPAYETGSEGDPEGKGDGDGGGRHCRPRMEGLGFRVSDWNWKCSAQVQRQGTGEDGDGGHG
jgi:hypothetical protein